MAEPEINEEDIFDPTKDRDGVSEVMPEARPAAQPRQPHSRESEGPEVVPFDAEQFDQVGGPVMGTRVPSQMPKGDGERDDVLDKFLSE